MGRNMLVRWANDIKCPMAMLDMRDLKTVPLRAIWVAGAFIYIYVVWVTWDQ